LGQVKLEDKSDEKEVSQAEEQVGQPHLSRQQLRKVCHLNQCMYDVHININMDSKRNKPKWTR